MTDIEFWRISFNDWGCNVNGTIRRSASSLELLTKSEEVKSFLTRCMETQEVISNPLVHVGQGFYCYAGNYKVSHVDEEKMILRKLLKK
ncbi:MULTISPECIES: hypothetical protein [Bhargavaea]|uniref:Uncharacterized protein n=1 Tax=Bhargavaea changchunensis TaxID=2134037 RepID=A0ABW2NF81_9BACL|nr:hypothetical protein [Bhargavaea sp. CC-171006]